MYEITRTDDVHQSMITAILRIALRPVWNVNLLSGPRDIDEPLSEILANTPPNIELRSGTSRSMASVDCSRSGFIGCFFYLAIILRADCVDSFLLNWFVEQLFVDVERTEDAMKQGSFSQSLWFWTVMFGASAAAACGPMPRYEEVQWQQVREDYMDKISVANQVLRIRDWEDAKSILSLFAWEDDFDGEGEIRALWEEAVVREALGTERSYSEKSSW